MTAGHPYFEVDVSELDGEVRVEVRGEVDAATADVLEQHLAEASGRSGHVTLDLQQVSFIDSSGLRVITAAGRDATDAGSRLEIAGASSQVRRIFDMTGLTRLLSP